MNQELSPTAEKSPGKPGPGILSLSSSYSGGQKASPTLQESPILLDSSISQTSLEEPLQRPLAGNMEIAPEGERKTAHPAGSSTSPISLEEGLLRESTGKMDMPPESGKKIVPFSDSPIPPVSLEESLRKESAGKMELSVGGENIFIRPSIQEESNGSERRPVRESNDFFPSSQPSLEMEANPRIGEGQVLKKQGPLFGATKEATGTEIPQNLQENDPLVGNQA